MQYTVSAKLRTNKGRSAMRRLRRAGRVPGVVYGIGEPIHIDLDSHRLTLDLGYEAFHSTVLNLEIDGKQQATLLREVQNHPVTDAVIHIDFQAIAADTEIATTVPLHYENAENSPGVKLTHGIFTATTIELQVHCLPQDLPESITIDVAHLEINQSIHLEEIQVPDGIRLDALVRGENPVLASVLPPASEEEEAVEVPTDEIVADEESAEGDKS